MGYHPVVNGTAFVLCAYGAFWAGWGLVRPVERFAQQAAQKKESRALWPLWRRASQHAHYWIAGIGLCILGWYAAGGFTDFIPPDWGSIDEDGDWTPTRDGLRAMIGLVLGLGTMALADRRPEEQVCRPIDRNAALVFLSALTDVRFKPGHLIRSKALKDLEASHGRQYGEPVEVSEYRDQYLRPLRAAVEADEKDQ